MSEIPQIARRSQPDGRNGAHRLVLRMHMGNTAVKRAAAVSATQGPVTTHTNTKGPKEEGASTIEEDEIDIWLKLSPQMHRIVEQHVQEQEKRDPGSTSSTFVTTAEPNTSYKEQVRGGAITDQAGAVGLKPGLPAQGPSNVNHSQIKQPTAKYQAAVSNDHERLYGLPCIRRDTPTPIASSQGDTVQDAARHHSYKPLNSFDTGTSQTQSDLELERIETHPPCGDGRLCCHDPDCREPQAQLQYPSSRENTRPEALFGINQINRATQASIYKYRSPRFQTPDCQEYHIAGRGKTPTDSLRRYPLGSIWQGYYNTIVRNEPLNRQIIVNEAVNSMQSYPTGSLKGKQVEPEQLCKSPPQAVPPKSEYQYWAQDGKTASSNNQAPVALGRQDVDEIASLRAGLRQGGHLQNCHLDKAGMRSDLQNSMTCCGCWKKLDAAEGLIMFWKNPVVHSRNIHQARAMARVTPQVPPPAQISSQAGCGGKEKTLAALKPLSTRKDESKPRGYRPRCKSIDQECPYEQQEAERQRVEAEHLQVNIQQLLPEVSVEEGRICLV